MKNDERIFLDDIRSTDQLLDAFHRWLESFAAVDDEQALLQRLSQCDRRLPPRLCVALDLPEGSTYAAASDLFRSLWWHVYEFDFSPEP